MTLSRRQFAALALAVPTVATLGTLPAFAGSATRKGTLSGRKGYNASGTISVVKADGQTKVVLGDDFLFDQSKNPPDIKIGFGNNETYAKGSKIHDALKINPTDAKFHKKGAATFDVPAGIDTDTFSEVYVYCEKFSVILGVAPLK